MVGYDYENSCDQAPSVCLGVPYFNWGPSYTNVAKSVGNDSFKATFDWVEPEIKNGKTDEDSMIGFKYGEALSNESKKRIESTAKDL